MIMWRKVLYRVVIVDSLFVIDSGFVVDVHNLVGFGIDFKFLILRYRLGSAIGSKWFKNRTPVFIFEFCKQTMTRINIDAFEVTDKSIKCIFFLQLFITIRP